MEKFSCFEEVALKMDTYTNLERKTDLYNRRTYRIDRMQALLNLFGNPEKEYRTIHVAGSKGKGSTAALLSAALTAAGEKTGLYMSPHVTDYRERFTLNGEFFDEKLYLKTAEKLFDRLEGFTFCDIPGENTPTTFELYTLFAFLLFREAHCTWAVIETGLGGRLDATNVVYPEASVITPIELEHCDILGNTIAKIAGEKAKIIKKGRPAFIAMQKDEARAVFEAEAKETGSEIFFIADEINRLQSETVVKDGQSVQHTEILFNDGSMHVLELKMLSCVQSQNCALALLVSKKLGFYREGITEKALENTSLPGRIELVKTVKDFYFDGAHTPNSFKSLTSTLSSIKDLKKCVAVFCCVNGKDYKTLCTMADEAFGKIIVSKPGRFKKSDPELVFQEIRGLGRKENLYLIEDADKALSKAVEICPEDGAVVVCGSFYMVGAAKEALCRLTGVKSN